jgi:hypothetical protein
MPLLCAFAVSAFDFLLLTYYSFAKIQKLLIFTDVFRGYSSDGRALEWHSRGQEFDPP